MAAVANPLSYAAFISYRHKPLDRYWARRIMRALEIYRTPKALRDVLPSRIGTLFRDEDEIPASTDLSDQIKDALHRSKFLIVVCSPDTPSSRWVRREIELFQEMGKGDQILAVLIAGEPDDSFPPELRRREVSQPNAGGHSEERWEEVEPIAADVRPRTDERKAKTEDRALLRLSAALLGCRYDDLARREDERRTTVLRARLATAAVCFAAVTVGTLWWWDAYLRIKSDYCANYNERWGVPSCLSSTAETAWPHRQLSWRIIRKGGQVIELSRVNGAGSSVVGSEPFDQGEPWIADVAKTVFGYSQSGANERTRLSSLTMFDQAGVLVRRIELQFSDDGKQAVARFDSTLGIADRQRVEATNLSGGINNDDNHTDIGQHRLFFGDDGLLVRRIFEPLGGGASTSDGLGAYGRSYEYNSDGLVARIRNLGANGETVADKAGTAELDRVYDKDGQLTSIEWRDSKGDLARNGDLIAKVLTRRDNAGNATEISLYEPGGSPAFSKTGGYASLRNQFDDHGNILETTYHGLNGQAVISPEADGSIFRMTYDAKGRRIDVRKYDVDGKPTLGQNGIFRASRLYNDRGNVIQETYFDADGLAALRRPDGVAGYKYTFNGEGALIGQSFVGADGKPTIRQDKGWAAREIKLDTQLRQTEISFWGPDARPAMDKTRGAARYTNEYDQHGNIARECFFGTADEPVLRKGWGAACRIWAYDDHGNEIERSSVDPHGKPILSSDEGSARTTIRYNDHGFPIEMRFAGLDGQPINGLNGSARTALRYDERGNNTEAAYYDTADKPTIDRKFGVHRVVRTYNEQNKIIDRSFYDDKDHLTAEESTGIARLSQEFDDRGNLITERFFGADGKPTLRKDWGAARVERKYDERNNQIEEALFGLDDKLTSSRDLGVAKIRDTYDSVGNEVATEFFGADGNLVLNTRDGIAVDLREYDPFGRVVERKYFGADGRPIIHRRYGFASFTVKYDERGNDVGSKFFGIDGSPIISAWGYARVANRYDERGNIIDTSCFDTEDKPVADKDYGVPRYQNDFDAYNHVVEERFMNIDEKLTNNSFGFARAVAQRNSSGLLVRENYFNSENAPVLRDNRLIPNEEIASGFDGDWMAGLLRGILQPSERITDEKAGFASVEQQFNDRGSLTFRAYFGLQGEPVNGLDGLSSESVVYDELNRPVSFSGRHVENQNSEGNRTKSVSARFIDDVHGHVQEILLDEIGSQTNPVKRILFDREPDGSLNSTVFKGIDGENLKVE